VIASYGAMLGFSLAPIQQLQGLNMIGGANYADYWQGAKSYHLKAESALGDTTGAISELVNFLSSYRVFYEPGSDSESNRPVVILVAGLGELPTSKLTEPIKLGIRDTLSQMLNINKNIKRVVFLGVQEIPTELSLRGHWFAAVVHWLYNQKDALRLKNIIQLDLWSPRNPEDLVEATVPGRGSIIIESPRFTSEALVNVVAVVKMILRDELPLA
jgi:hypothetical protein